MPVASAAVPPEPGGVRSGHYLCNVAFGMIHMRNTDHVAFDLSWAPDDEPGRWNLTGTNNLLVPISNVTVIIENRSFWYPVPMDVGDSHMFWSRLSEDEPTSTTETAQIVYDTETETSIGQPPLV